MYRVSEWFLPTYNGVYFLGVSVQFSRSVMSNSLRPHEPQHTRPPYPSPTLEVHPNPCPMSQWCHPTILSSVVPFSSCPQSFPASGSFPVSQPFASGGQSFGVSASTSVLPMNTQDWSPLGWIGWISLQSKGLSSMANLFTFLLCFYIFLASLKISLYSFTNWYFFIVLKTSILLSEVIVLRLWYSFALCSNYTKPLKNNVMDNI